MTTETTITIEPAEGSADTLFCLYGGQGRPQRTFIQLDLESGRVTADYDPEIGGAVPIRVWSGIVRRYYLPEIPTPNGANALMAELQPLLERVLAGSGIYWDGSNWRPYLSEEAEETEHDIEDRIEHSGYERFHYILDAEEWLYPVRAELRARHEAGESIEALATEFQGSGLDASEPYIPGIERAIERLIAESQEQRR